MPESRVQITVEIETEGAEQLTALRRELEQLGQAGAGVVEQLEQSRALVAATTQSFLHSHRQLFAALEPLFQGFFRRLLAGAHNFRDVFKRLLADLLDFFLRTLARMVAGWFSAFRQMSGASLGGSAGFFGLLSPFFSGGFGLQGGPGGTPPFFPGGGGGTATNIGLLERFGINLHGLGPIPGGLLFSGGLLGLLLGISRGSPLLGGLGGAGLGFSLGGPIGAVIGGILGFLGGVFTRGRRRRAAAQAEAAFAQQLVQIVREFEQFRIEYQQAVDAVTALWGEFRAVMPQRYGKYGWRAIRNITPFVEATYRRLNEIQAARELRGQLIQALPIPEFQRGGLVDQVLGQMQAIHSSSGKVLAFLHRGEAVLNARAVQALGAGAIQQLNQAPAFQRGGFVSPAAASGRDVIVNVFVFPAPGMDERALAAYTAREINRRLRDKGRRLG